MDAFSSIIVDTIFGYRVVVRMQLDIRGRETRLKEIGGVRQIVSAYLSERILPYTLSNGELTQYFEVVLMTMKKALINEEIQLS